MPVAEHSSYPMWIAGPTGFLTNWFSPTARDERVLFTVLIATMLVAYLIAVYAAPRLRARWVLGAIVVLHLIFLLSPPLTLSDVFNYLNYGRMEAVYHLNPYVTIPALEPHADPTFLLSNWHGLLSPYGPLFTVFTMALVPLGVAGSFWAMKVTLMLASLGTVLLVYRCAQLLGRNALAAALIVGINPIVLVWGLGGDHNDFLMTFLLVLGFWLLLRADSLRVGKRARPAPDGPGGWGGDSEAPGPGSTGCRDRSCGASRRRGWRSAPAPRSSRPCRSRPRPPSWSRSSSPARLGGSAWCSAS